MRAAMSKSPEPMKVFEVGQCTSPAPTSRSRSVSTIVGPHEAVRAFWEVVSGPSDEKGQAAGSGSRLAFFRVRPT